GFVGTHNAPVLDALRHHSQPGRAIYLWGSAGSGRTHLLRAITRNETATYLNPQADAGPNLLALADNETQSWRLIAVDNVHALSSPQQAALFTLYNQWRQQAGTANAFTLVTAGSHAPRALSLREDLRTRLAWDLVFR